MVVKKFKVVISNKARASLRDHIKYLKQEVSAETAEYVRKGIIDTCKNLAVFSGFSVERYLETEDKKYRSVTKWSYDIIFTVLEDTVRILNIIHRSQHPEKRKDIY